MPRPRPVRAPRPARPGTRALVVEVIRQTGAAAVARAPRHAPAPGVDLLSPYRLPGAFTRRLVGRIDRLLVERAGRIRLAAVRRSQRRER